LQKKSYYETAKCKNIVIAQAIKSLGELFPRIKSKRTILEFAKRQLKNSRPATRKKAEKFISKYQKLVEK
jgi:hypothetical protein